MTRSSRILFASAVVWLAAAPAGAGTLDFWEDTRGAQDVTAVFPTGVAQTAVIVFDADSAEGGGVWDSVTDIRFRPTGSVVFTDFSCPSNPCVEGDDYVIGQDAEGPFLYIFSENRDTGERHGIFEIGTITFDGPQEPGSVQLDDCYYTDVNIQEHSCSSFVLVQLPEPAGAAALIAGAVLLFGPLRRRRVR